LDFCHKYRFEASKREILSEFLNKLKDKKQNKDQQKHAAHAISVFAKSDMNAFVRFQHFAV